MLRSSLFQIILAGIFMTSNARATECIVINHYRIKLLPGYALRDVTPPMADFELKEIYKAKDRGKKVTVYFGNAPSFPTYNWGNSLPSVEQSKGTKKWFDYEAGHGALEGLSVFHGLSYRGSSQSPYTQVHYFGEGLDEETAAQLKEIVSSIKVVKRVLN